MALVRVYCGLASAYPPRQLAVGSASLSATIVDDAGRILDICDIGDDSYGYAYLSTLLGERATGPHSVAIATDNDQQLVTRLLITAGWAISVVDVESIDDYTERFADPLADNAGSAPTQRRALGLARALQAGTISAALLSAAPELCELRPVLAAHNALANGRQAAAAALREVLRELHPAALRAYADPADPVALAVVEALPEPSMLNSGRGRDILDNVTSQLTNAGVGDQAAITEAITALRVAVAETSRRGATSRSLTRTIAETVRHSVAAVRACDAASSALVAALAERADRAAAAQPAADSAAAASAAAQAGGTPTHTPQSTRAASPGAATTADYAAPGPTAAPDYTSAAGSGTGPDYTATPGFARAPTRVPGQRPAVATPPQTAAPAPSANGGFDSPAGSGPPAPAGSAPPDGGADPPLARRSAAPPEPAGTPRGHHSAAPPEPAGTPRGHHSAAPPEPAGTPRGHRSATPHPPPQRQPEPDPAVPPLTPAAPIQAPQSQSAPVGRGGSAVHEPDPSGYRAHNRPVSPPPPPPPGITPIQEPPRSREPLPRRSRTGQEPAPAPRADLPPDRSGYLPPGARSTWPTRPTDDDRAAPAEPSGNGHDQLNRASESGRKASSPTQEHWSSRPSAVTPPWHDDDLQPPEPPMLRLVEPRVPDMLRDDLDGYRGAPAEPPPLRLVAPSSGDSASYPRSAPPVSADDDDNLLIFAQTRSAWFDHDPDSSSWSSAMDLGWQAAEQASSQPVVGDRTGAGLPRRVPHANLVPGAPPRQEERPLRVARDPASIAAHTSGYFSGWRRGQEVGGFPLGTRHNRRAAGAWEFHRDEDRLSG